MAKARGNYMGFEKEPPKEHPKAGGRRPVVHSHSARPKRSLKTGTKKSPF